MSTSTTEAKLLSVLNAGKKATWWDNLFKKLNFDTGHEPVMFIGNTHTVRLRASELDLILTELRHIDVSQR